jgi:hypothetical protein
LITLLIILAEIGFWIFILLGFVIRYFLKKPRLSIWILGATPLIDLLLLIFVTIDLNNGAEATFAHTIAAIYIGVSIAFGKQMITWADIRFQYYFLKIDNRPIKLFGIERGKKEIRSFMQHLVAYLIGGILLIGMIYFSSDETSTDNILATLRYWSIILGIDFLISISYVLFPPSKKS